MAGEPDLKIDRMGNHKFIWKDERWVMNPEWREIPNMDYPVTVLDPMGGPDDRITLYEDGKERRHKASDAKIAVVHPAHYGGDTVYEAIKVIEAWDLGFNLGNALKYICREGKKGGIEDLEKAREYLAFEIAKRKRA